MLTAHTTLPGLTSSVPTARRFAEQVLAGWGHPDAGWTAAQVVSELAANCALHARTEFRVTVTADDRAIRIEVQDSAPGVVQQRSYSETATTGRGLRMVTELASDWGVEVSGTGKTVWVRLPLDGAPAGKPDLDVLLSSYDEAGTVVSLPSQGGQTASSRAAA